MNKSSNVNEWKAGCNMLQVGAFGDNEGENETKMTQGAENTDGLNIWR
jgi:hypothetical protein